MRWFVDAGVLGEIELEIEVDFYPGRPATMYGPGGDPGHPADPAELEVTSATYQGRDVLFLVKDYLEQDDSLLCAMWEDHHEKAA